MTNGKLYQTNRQPPRNVGGGGCTRREGQEGQALFFTEDDKKRSQYLGILFCVLLVVGGVGGCASSDRLLTDAYEAYNQGQYDTSLTLARSMLNSASRTDRHEAAYLAGLSAYRIKQSAAAQRYLNIAKLSGQTDIAGDAYAALGVIASESGRFDSAHQMFIEASKRLNGEHRARAYFYTAIAQQKLGYWSTAWMYMALAEGLTRDPVFRRKIAVEKAYTGWTVQTGAFTKKELAQHQAQQVTRSAGGLEVGAARIVTAVDSASKTMYLVQIGNFSSYTTAEQARSQLGFASARCVPRGGRE